MHRKYRITSNDVQYVAHYDEDGSHATLNVWKGDEVVKHLSFIGNLPKDEDMDGILREELDDPYLEVERWTAFTVQYDLTSSVSVSFNAFEGDMEDGTLADDLLETDFEQFVLSLFKADLDSDPYIEVGHVEDGADGIWFNDEKMRPFINGRDKE